MTSCPVSIFWNRLRTALLERLTKGPQVQEPRYPRTESTERARMVMVGGHELGGAQAGEINGRVALATRALET